VKKLATSTFKVPVLPMQNYPITEEQLLAALTHAQIEGNYALVYLPRLTLGEELPAIQFPCGVSIEKARDDILTNILPLIRAGRIGIPAKKATHQAGLTIH
jgi:hypothetical protein